MRAFAPNGRPIVAALETIQTTYGLTLDEFGRNDAGELTFQFGPGDVTPHWDTGEAVVRDGKCIYVDDCGEEWPEDKIELRP